MFQQRGWSRWAVAATVALTAACAGQTDARAQEREVPPAMPQAPAMVDTVTAANLSATFRAAAAEALPAVVYIRVEAKPQMARRQIPSPFAPFFEQPQGERPTEVGAGSGFIYSDDGYIITNRHVVADATEVTVTLHDQRVYDATVVGTDPNTDVAVIKIEPKNGEKLPVAQLGNSDALQVGDWVLALGNPLGLNFTVTAGIVSAKGRQIGILRQNNDQALEAFIQTDAAINRGNSGGPLVDLLGRVVGVNSAIQSPTGAYAGNGFAIPVALVRRVASDLIEYGTVHRPRLGVLIGDVTEADADVYHLDRIAGAVVTQIQPDGPAADADLELGDVIVSLNGEPVARAVDLTTRLARMAPGDRIHLGIIRNGEHRNVTVKLGEFQESSPDREVATDNRPRAERLLGFKVAALTRDIADQCQVPSGDGVVVSEVDGLGPAAGRVGRCTVVLSINGTKVDSPSDVEKVAGDLSQGDVVSLRIYAPGSDTPQITNYRLR